MVAIDNQPRRNTEHTNANRSRGHRLILLDRGEQHRHRWNPTCECGWLGKYRRRKCDAKEEHRAHVNQKISDDKRRRITGGYKGQARKLTPWSQLPEQLR